MNNHTETLVVLSDVVYKDYTDISASAEALLYQINNTRFNIWEEVYDENYRIENNATANKLGLIVYPNPTTKTLYIDCIECDNSELANYTITGIIGNILHAGSILGTHSTIDVSNLTPGIYLLKSELSPIPIKLIIQ